MRVSEGRGGVTKKEIGPASPWHLGNIDLWKTSGHADFYAENMYQPMQAGLALLLSTTGSCDWSRHNWLL